jgi:hypothetical protein
MLGNDSSAQRRKPYSTSQCPNAAPYQTPTFAPIAIRKFVLTNSCSS